MMTTLWVLYIVAVFLGLLMWAITVIVDLYKGHGMRAVYVAWGLGSFVPFLNFFIVWLFFTMFYELVQDAYLIKPAKKK